MSDFSFDGQPDHPPAQRRPVQGGSVWPKVLIGLGIAAIVLAAFIGYAIYEWKQTADEVQDWMKRNDNVPKAKP
jgi:hypothetical protein